MSNEWISVEDINPSNDMTVDVWIGIVDGVGIQVRLPYVKYEGGEFYDFMVDDHGCGYYGDRLDGVTHWIHITPPDTTQTKTGE